MPAQLLLWLLTSTIWCVRSKDVLLLLKNGEVVSDTPDPTHAQFTGENPKADTDMFFFDEDVEIDNVDVLPKDENEEDIFDNLESVVSDESTEEEQGGEQ